MSILANVCYFAAGFSAGYVFREAKQWYTNNRFFLILYKNFVYSVLFRCFVARLSKKPKLGVLEQNVEQNGDDSDVLEQDGVFEQNGGTRRCDIEFPEPPTINYFADCNYIGDFSCSPKRQCAPENGPDPSAVQAARENIADYLLSNKKMD